MDKFQELQVRLDEAVAALNKLNAGSGWIFWATTAHVRRLSTCLLVVIEGLQICLAEVERLRIESWK